MNPIIKVQNLNFSYSVGSGKSVPVLHDLNFEIYPGEFVAIQGSSGSGKSTLLYLLGCLCPIQEGQITIGGVDISKLKDDELAIFRNENLGFVFQQFHLLAKTNVLENILLPSHYPIEKPKNLKKYHDKALELAAKFGLTDRLHHGPQELSGGQQQRVAIARALINDASIIFADEPTGNLDTKTTDIVMQELKALNQSGKTVIVITHEKSIADQTDRTIFIRDGRVMNDGKISNIKKHNIESKLTQPHLPFLSGVASYMRLIPFAMANIFRNKARSILTMVGVSIGVASVLSMITLGQFAKEKILASYAELGINTLIFRGNQNWGQMSYDKTKLVYNGFSWEKDLLPLQRIFPEIIKMSPLIPNWLDKIHFAGKFIDDDARIVGVNDEAFLISNRQIALGSPISFFHVKNQSQVCVIGAEVVEKLFSNISPIGETLKLETQNQSYSCRVIGTLMPLRSNKSDGRSPDLEVYIPFSYLQSVVKYWWQKDITDVLMLLKDGTDIEKVGKGIQSFFQNKYGKSGRFRASADSVLIGQMKQFLNIFSIFLTSVALISLSVGGIGIANMMLVSVSERYREIGLRKALGATNVSIRKQFLLEAVLLCAIAGFFGLVFGFIGYEAIIWAGSKLIPKLKFEWVINWSALFFSTLSILAVGILSGYIPAVRAEKLAPIQALRTE